MAADSLTRYVHYISTRILNAEELMTQQAVNRNMDGLGNPIAYGLNAIYRDGSLMNATATLNNTTVSFTPIDATKPMLVFCRGIWEPFTMVPLNLGSSSTLFLNYTIVSTPQPDNDAEMGELQLSFSTVSTNGAPNNANRELERNSNPISVLTLVGGVISIQNPVYPQAQGTGKLSGLVQLTTNTSQGKALASDDPAVTNQRVPVDASVTDSKVAPVTVTGTNTDGSPKVAPANTGGVDSKKLIYVPGTNTVEGELTSLAGSIAGVVSTLNGHIGRALGPGVHVMPNYADVGAAPASHVGADLTVAHSPIFTSDHNGFTVVRNPAVAPSAADFAYLVQDNAGNPIAGIKHNGDFHVVNPAYSSLSSALTALYSHVSQTSHSNPHGLALTPDLIPYYPVQQGTGIAQFANLVKLGWDGGGLRATVDATDLGDIVFQNMLQSDMGGTGYFILPASPKPIYVQWVTGVPDRTKYNNALQTLPFKVQFPTQCVFAIPGTFAATQAGGGTPDYGEGATFTIQAWNQNGVSFWSERNADHGQNLNAPLILAVGY